VAGAPSPPDALPPGLLPIRGRALDVACGRGLVAVWLAQQGLEVDAVDVSPVGLAHGAELASRCGVSVSWVHADLDDGLPVTGPYALVVCQRFWDRRLHLSALLEPGGLLVMTVLSGRSGAFRAPPGALLEVAAGLEVLVHEEAAGEACLVARARRDPHQAAR
jgi:SAM-dependent methyltransferase